MNQNAENYDQSKYYCWRLNTSYICYKVLQLLPPVSSLNLLDIGCGEGSDAVFFARNGYQVFAFDISEISIQKTKEYAQSIGLSIEAFQADINQYKLETNYDIIFSSGVMQYIPSGFRKQIITNYQEHTTPGGLNVFNVFVKKSFIPTAPDREPNSYFWYSGEILSYYWDWKIEYFKEEIFDYDSSGVTHQHAVNRIIARKIQG